MTLTTLYLDTEFTGLRQFTHLISLAVVSNSGKAFYAEFTDFQAHLPTDTGTLEWLEKNVLESRLLQDKEEPYLLEDENILYVKGNKSWVCEYLKIYLQRFDKIEIWGDCPIWDWVLFCELFGGAMQIPSHIFYLPFDLVTLFKLKGLDPNLNRAEWIKDLLPDSIKNLPHHNALKDAWCIRCCHQKLYK